MIAGTQVALRKYSALGEKRLGLARAVADLRKTCMKCGRCDPDVLTLRCTCMFCRECLRRELLKRNESLLFNTFEVNRKQEAICVCPNHSYAISTRGLQAAFEGKKLEEYSIRAMKRQIAESITH